MIAHPWSIFIPNAPVTPAPKSGQAGGVPHFTPTFVHNARIFHPYGGSVPADYRQLADEPTARILADILNTYGNIWGIRLQGKAEFTPWMMAGGYYTEPAGLGHWWIVYDVTGGKRYFNAGLLAVRWEQNPDNQFPNVAFNIAAQEVRDQLL
jgi:hypothetical protein